jgi:hypothetical protein
VADKYHSVERRIAVLRIELFANLSHRLAQISRRHHVRLPGRIAVEPELKVLPQLRIRPQIVEHGRPSHWRRQEAMHHHHRDFPRLVRLKRIEALLAIQLVAAEETKEFQVAEVGVGKEVSERRREIAFQRNPPPTDFDHLDRQWIVEFKRPAAMSAKVSESAFEAEERGHRETDIARIPQWSKGPFAPKWRRWLGPCAHERHAEPVPTILILQADNLVVAAEEQGTELLRPPAEAVLHDAQLETQPVRRR